MWPNMRQVGLVIVFFVTPLRLCIALFEVGGEIVEVLIISLVLCYIIVHMCMYTLIVWCV